MCDVELEINTNVLRWVGEGFKKVTKKARAERTILSTEAENQSDLGEGRLLPRTLTFPRKVFREFLRLLTKFPFYPKVSAFISVFFFFSLG